MAKRRKRRKHSGRARKFNRARKSSRKIFRKRRKGGKRRASAAIKKRGAFVKAMWKKHRARYLLMRKKKGGFGKISREINAAYKG